MTSAASHPAAGRARSCGSGRSHTDRRPCRYDRGFRDDQGGDIRTGLFPLTMAVAFTLLAACAHAVLQVHQQPLPMVTIGGWWTTLALLGPAGFFAGVAVGAALGLEEATLGGFAVLPVASMGFGITTLPVACHDLRPISMAFRPATSPSIHLTAHRGLDTTVVDGLRRTGRRHRRKRRGRRTGCNVLRSPAPHGEWAASTDKVIGHRAPAMSKPSASVATSHSTVCGTAHRTGEASEPACAHHRSTLTHVAQREQAPRRSRRATRPG
jgi:hypothetical protein